MTVKGNYTAGTQDTHLFPPVSKTRPLQEEQEPSIDELIELLQSHSSPLIDFNKKRLKAAIKQYAAKERARELQGVVHSFEKLDGTHQQALWAYKHVIDHVNGRIDELSDNTGV
jgi:hypothetical protein